MFLMSMLRKGGPGRLDREGKCPSVIPNSYYANSARLMEDVNKGLHSLSERRARQQLYGLNMKL